VLVRELKFRGVTGLAEVMAAQVAATAPSWLLSAGPAGEAPRLVPVPLHRGRARRRGFNQAERIATALGERTGLAVDDCLERGGGGGTQMGRDRAERAVALTGAIRARAPAPEVAVVVDDVATTGATVAACAHALRRAGAREVRGLAYAHTPGR
jgi:ComF family protein